MKKKSLIRAMEVMRETLEGLENRMRRIKKEDKLREIDMTEPKQGNRWDVIQWDIIQNSIKKTKIKRAI